MRLFLLSLLLIACSLPTQAAFAPAAAERAPASTLTSADLTRSATEARLGRKLKFKERIALSLLRAKVKRGERRAARGGSANSVSGLALGSFIAGILALASLSLPASGLLFLLLVPTAIVLGIVALTQFRKKPYQTGRGFAIAGIVMGSAWLLLGILAVAISLLLA